MAVVTKSFLNEIKWIAFCLALALVFVKILNGGSRLLFSREHPGNTFIGLNLFLEILVFFVFSIFVVFGIKGFFERFSQRFCNTLVFLTGIILLAVIVLLSYQVLSVS